MSVRITREEATARLARFQPQLASDGDHRAAAVVLAIVEADDGTQAIWLTKRQPTLRSHSGQWALPGGRIDEGETAEQAGLRELAEEIGYHAPETDVIGRLDDFVTRSGYVMSPFVVWVGAGATYQVNPDEVVHLFDVSFAELDIEPILVSIPESDRPVIQLPLLGRKVHAPTAAVMYQFREVVLRDRATRVAHFEQPKFAWK